MLWFYLALSTAVLSATFNLLSRKLAVKSISPRAFSFVFNFWAAIFAGIIFLFQTKNFQISSFIIVGLIILSVALYGLFERLQFFARKQIEASNITILFRISPIITFIGSIFVFNEILTFNKLIGFIFIIIASFLVTYRKETKFSLNKPFLIVAVCAIALGLSRIVDKGVVNTGFSVDFYNFILWVGPLLFIYLPYIPRKELKGEMIVGSWKIPLTALINVAVLYTQLYALSLADASLVIPVISASTVLTVIGGIVFLNERENILKKILAAITVFIGIILIK